jgi:hypothetical protein
LLVFHSAGVESRALHMLARYSKTELLLQLHSHVHCNTIQYPRNGNNLSVNQLLNSKENVLHIHNEIIFSH